MEVSGCIRTLVSMASMRKASPAQRRHAAVCRRDSALERVAGITAGIGITVVAAVGLLGVYVSRALPGHHAATTSNAATGVGGTAAGTGTTGATGNSGNATSINPPGSAPQATTAPSPVSTGAS
jgi:hypothetical protein